MEKKPAAPVLLVDDDEVTLNMMRLTLQAAGLANSVTLSDSLQVMPFLSRHKVSMVLLDIMMPNLTGLELLPLLRRDHPNIPVVLITGVNELGVAVDCMKQGAHEYLVKPVEPSRLIACVRNALKLDSLMDQVISLKKRLLEDTFDKPEAFADIRTCSGKMRSIFQYIEIVARSSEPILITGETGVGKELVAQAIHRVSGVRGEFVTLNVAGLDDNMFSDTLFGHRKGAFTGAEQAREGLVGRADRGTIFLDEIGDLSELSQVKLLRLLQEHEYYPVGSDVTKTSTARVVVATNHDLNEQMAKGKFRRDLFYRLCTHQVHIPPLRERKEDIALLFHHFIEEAANALGKPAPTAAEDAVPALLKCRFPGNVRELKAMVFDAVARSAGGILTGASFSPCTGQLEPDTSDRPPLSREGSLFSLFGHFPTFREMEDYLIDEALALSGNSLNMAAMLLGVTRQTITNRLKSRGQGADKGNGRNGNKRQHPALFDPA